MSRKTLRHVALAAGIASLVGFAGVASADPANFIPAGEFRAKFTNYEVAVSGALGQELFGLLNITQITNAAGTTTFWNGNGGSDGTQLVGYFEGGTTLALDQSFAGTNLSFTGGKIVIYNVPNGTFSPSTNPNTKDYVNQLCGGVCPTPWLTADIVPGINDALVGTSTVNYPGGTNPGDATIQAAVATTLVNSGNGFLSVTGGTWASKFDTNGFNFTNFAPADMSLRSNFVLQGPNCSEATSQGWQVCSDDPIDAFAIPEPGTLALIGLAAVAAGTVRRRKAAA